ncbi:Protein TASOR [Schistosoma japonicum]|nr:Protein TASOR [Schistosoma japonicum]
MTSRKRFSYKRKLSVLAGLEALNSFKVPKKQNNLSLLENIDLNSADYLEEIYPQINQSFRFPQLSSHFNVENAWFIHNKTLEDSFSQARKRFQKNLTNNAVTGTELSLCTGFLVVSKWSDVEKIASDGLIPGNDPDTWLGQQKLGLVVNQCADLTIAREQSRLPGKNIDQFLYLIMVRWVKSRAYIVSPEAEHSVDRLEPQPGYACHVSTWSRMDLLDPSKLTLEQAFHLSQVYLYEFDEDLELRTKLEHVIPYAVLKCRWKLTSDVASKIDTISTTSGSILIISPQPDITHLLSVSRTALLPTPQIPPIQKKSTHKLLTSKSKVTPSMLESKNLYKHVKSGLLPSPTSYNSNNNNNSVLQSPPINNTSAATVGSDNSSDNLLSSPVQQSKLQATTPTHTTGVLNALIAHARKLQASCGLFQFYESPNSVNDNNNTMSTITNSTSSGLISYDHNYNTVNNELTSTVIGISLLTWGYPKPEYSLAMEISTFRKGELIVFDGILQPCLHIQRLVPHSSLHYELAGLRPWSSKPFDTNGPPVLVSVPCDQEWCLPRLNPTTASSLQSDPSPFGGYRGNYFRLTLHESGGRRTDMAQFCQALQNSAMAGVIPMPCDESSIMFLFPECQFSKSIGIPVVDNLDKSFLHAILLTPYNLRHYPYNEICCCQSLNNTSNNVSNSNTSSFVMASAAPVGASTDSLFGQRKATSICVPSMQLKLPLSRILTTLTDGGRNLLGSALISVLAHQNVVEEACSSQASNTRTSFSFSDPRLQQHNPTHLDPRLNRRSKVYTNEPDWYALATALISSAPEKKMEQSTTSGEQQASHLEDQLNSIPKALVVTTTSIVSTTAPITSTAESAYVETHDIEDPIPAPSSPETESKYHPLSLMSPQTIPKVIPLDGQQTCTATFTLSTATVTSAKPLSASSPSNLDMCNVGDASVNQNISVDMEIDNNDRCDQSFQLNKSDMEIEQSFNLGNNRSPLALRYHEPAPTPPTTTNCWDYSSQLSLLVSDYRKASSPPPSNKRSTTIRNDDSTRWSNKSTAIRHRPNKSTYSDCKYDDRYDHYRHRSRSPNYHKSKSNPSLHIQYRSSKYDSDERHKSSFTDHYPRSSGHNRSRGRDRDRDRRTLRLACGDDDEEVSYRSSRTHLRSPSYSDSDSYYYTRRHYPRHRSSSVDSSITGTDSNSVASSNRDRRDYYPGIDSRTGRKGRSSGRFSSHSQTERNSHQMAQHNKNNHIELKSGYSKRIIDNCPMQSSIDSQNVSNEISDKDISFNDNYDCKSQYPTHDSNKPNDLNIHNSNSNHHTIVASNENLDLTESAHLTIHSNKPIDEGEEGEVLDDDDGDDCDNVNEEFQSKDHVFLSDSSASNNAKGWQSTLSASGNRQHQHHTTNDKLISNHHHNTSTPRKDGDGKQEEEKDDDSSVDPSSFQRLQVGYILSQLVKHGNVESEPPPNTAHRKVVNTSVSSSRSEEDEYKLVDETFNSTDVSDYSTLDTEVSLEDKDMRQTDHHRHHSVTKHYGNFYPSNVFCHMTRKRRVLSRNMDNHDSFSDHEDEISNVHEKDTDYRRLSANWSSEHYHHPHRQLSLLGNYTESSTSSSSESQPRYSFYRPRGSNSNQKSVYSPRSSSLLPDNNDKRHTLPRSRNVSTSNSTHQIPTEYYHEIATNYRNTPLLGNPNIPVISCPVNPTVPLIPSNPGLLPMTARYPTVQPPLLPTAQSTNLWSSGHQFYSKPVNIYNQPTKPWQ